MPLDLVFVRHGRSEGNEARDQSKRGDESCYTDEFRARPNREWRLTDLGLAQAQAAGRCIREQISPVFSRYYTSEYLRARETAAHLALPGARWVQDILLRERSWGRADFVMPESERYELFGAELADAARIPATGARPRANRWPTSACAWSASWPGCSATAPEATASSPRTRTSCGRRASCSRE